MHYVGKIQDLVLKLAMQLETIRV